MTTPRSSAKYSNPDASAATSILPDTAPRPEDGAASNRPGVKAATQLRNVAGRATETYTAYGVTENFVKECSKQADYSIPQAADGNAEVPKTVDGEDLGVGSGWWHTELGLKPTFSTWSQVTMLHIYLLSVRFRCLPASISQTWQQHLLDHFFYDAENRMLISHNMHARGTRNKYLKDLFIQWRGLLAAYDEGLVKGDAVLAAAVWRNIFKADENADIKGIAATVSYMRRALKGLDTLPDEAVMTGELGFGDPKAEMDLVLQRSKMMDLPFKDGAVVNEPVAAQS
ncbi:MAG: Protein cbp3, mitochondrial [Claussenomyces sp. TS43310]|nr:MAG: Protein cbp3, mitochondrial [Claussenomyces sp. TS43310]